MPAGTWGQLRALLLALIPLENGMQYPGVMCTVLAVASGAIAQDMPRCSPKKAEFAEEYIRTKTVDWSYRRAPGQSGEEYGGDYWIPDPERNGIVEWDAKEAAVCGAAVFATCGLSKRKKGGLLILPACM